MSDNPCPNCGEALPRQAINLAEGVALCDACGRLSRLSDVVARRRPTQETLGDPPRGCRVSARGDEVRVRATMRSVTGLIGVLFFTLFWNGITSVFVLIAAGNLFEHFIGPLPAWFPFPDKNGMDSLGETLFLCVFLTPFVAVGLGSFAMFMLTAFGRVEVVMRSREAHVSTGVGPFDWRRRFDPDEVRQVGFDTAPWQQNERPVAVIAIECDRTVKFGSMLSEERREWMQAVLQQMLTVEEIDRVTLARELMNAQAGYR